MRYVLQLAGLCLSLAAGTAHAQANIIPPCKDAEDQGPCLLAQDKPFQGVQPAPGLSAHVVQNHIVISWSGPAKDVRLLGDFQLNRPLLKLNDELRQVVVQYAQADKFKSAIRVQVSRLDGTSGIETVDLFGPQAEPLPERSGVTEQTLAFAGSPLAAHVWLPPGYQPGRRYPIVYVGDSGANTGSLAAGPMRGGTLPAAIVVGVDVCAESDPNRYCRSQRYLDIAPLPGQPPITDPKRFAEYEQFFVHTVVPQVEAKFGAPADRTQRAVAGSSNGATWAASMALSHPELFGRAIVMSPAGTHIFPPLNQSVGVFALSGGEFEPGFVNRARCLAGAIVDGGGTATLRTYPAGHTDKFWQNEFMQAMKEWLVTPTKDLKLAPSRPSWCPARQAS